MRNQQQIWHDEHSQVQYLPSMAKVEPSSAVVEFAKFLTGEGITPRQKVIDIGCGKGRNAVYLAELGYEVYAMDYIEPALTATRSLAKNRGVSTNINLVCTEIDSTWPFPSDFFDIAVDSFSSIDIETPAGREVYCAELFRTLKPGGLAMVAVVSADDEMERQLIRLSPGSEHNSTFWPQNGKFQKDYDEPELRALYRKFRIVELKQITKPAFKLGRKYMATNFWLVVQKP